MEVLHFNRAEDCYYVWTTKYRGYDLRLVDDHSSPTGLATGLTKLRFELEIRRSEDSDELLVSKKFISVAEAKTFAIDFAATLKDTN